MNKSDIHRHNNETPYNWEGVMEFLYNQYQHTAQKQNIWALQRDSLKENVKQLEGKIMALENINKDLKNRNNILEHSLRQIKIKQHEKRNQMGETANQQNSDLNQQIQNQLPKVPQRRPKPNKANLSRMLCSLGIPELLQDIKKDLQSQQQQSTHPNHKPQTKKGFQLDLSKMQVQPRNAEVFDKKQTYQVTCTLEGHHDGVRDAVFINYNNQLKQIVSASEDSTLKVWEVKKNSHNQIQKVQCIETIRDHSGPIFTCVQGDGYLFTGGMEGVIRAYNFKNHSTEKKHLVMKWKTDEDERLQPLWQLLYDKNNKLLIATASQMPIKAYKIPQLQQNQRISSTLKIKPYCQFLYSPKNYQGQDSQEFIPTAVCLFNQNLVASYFNSSSLINYDIETQRIVHELSYKIDVNLSANKLVSHPRCIIGAYEDCNVRIFDEKKMVDCFKAHNQPVMGISVNLNNANSLFTCSQDGYVRLWDMRNLKQQVWQTLGHQKKNDEAAHCIQTNFDGTTVSGGADSLLKIYTPTILRL